MRSSYLAPAFVAWMCICGIAAAQHYTVVPPAYANADAPGQLWVPGASTALRQQQIIGAPLLQGLVGKTLTALEFRRDAQDAGFAAGLVDLTVSLSITPRAPLQAATAFAANVGPFPVQVFQGQLALPASPATLAADWTASNLMRIPFQVPFTYSGGNLCIDITGLPVAGQVAGWWPADAERSPETAAIVDLGGGCGVYGGPLAQWSAVETTTIVPGGDGSFHAVGPSGSFGLLALGNEFPGGWPLSLVLPAAPAACRMFVDLPLAIAVVPFAPYVQQVGRADHTLRIPNTASLTGAALTAQWIDWLQQVSSNAIRWTIGAVPTIQMAHLDGYASDPDGVLFVHLAHVVRFEHD